MDTLGSMKKQILDWLNEEVSDSKLADAINDAVESLWDSVLLVHLGEFMGGPIQTINFAAGDERQDIVSIADPLIAPVTATVVEGALLARTVTIAYTFVTESGSETKISPLAAFAVPGNSVIKVTSPAFPGTPTQGTVPIGYNVYGTDIVGGARLALQNDSPIPFGAPWQEPSDTGVIDEPGRPSPPQVNSTADDIFFIKKLEVKNPDGTWTPWQGAAMESLLFSRAERTIAPASSYQTYAFDFVNGRTIELRPAAGIALNPRMFYVKKPRRMRFDQAIIPFTNFSATEFIRDYGCGKIMLSNREYQGYHEFTGCAEKKKSAIILGLNMQNRMKQTTITPYMR